ncbi:P-loop containing nucleoside triphosphate hydrolase protein, partial [Coemansia reversa NRRL 1564]
MGDGGLSERYLFAGVFPTLARQPRVFEVCAVPVVSDLFAGYNTLLFSYGITNSGKTYTVQGNSQMPGLLPRSIKSILDEDGGEDGWVYQLYVSYFEVYNEMIYDLLDLDTLTTIAGRARTALLLRSEGGRGNEAFVDGLVEVRVRNVRDLVRVLQHGQLRRAVHATGLNGGSSRSHALFQAKLVRLPTAAAKATGAVAAANAASAQASVRTLTVVDLAGSERAKRTGTHGERLAEAGKINASLMTLKKCLDVRRFNASSEGEDASQLVPYNESKVTRLFQPALDGGAKTVMVVCIDPYEHTMD